MKIIPRECMVDTGIELWNIIFLTINKYLYTDKNKQSLSIVV